MSMLEIPVECAHEPCNCSVAAPVESGEGYCGDLCRNAVENGEEHDVCACGHPACDTP